MPSEIDFTYVSLLPQHLQRAVAYYEYARESAFLCELGALMGNNVKHLHLVAQFIGREAILLGIKGFPRASARDNKALYDAVARMRPPESFGIPKPLVHVPWDMFFCVPTTGEKRQSRKIVVNLGANECVCDDDPMVVTRCRAY